MKHKSLNRGLALLLSVCMMLSMNGGAILAAGDGLPGELDSAKTSNQIGADGVQRGDALGERDSLSPNALACLDLIGALPTIEEYEEVMLTLDSGVEQYRATLAEQVKAARAAYDALTDAEKAELAAVDPTALDKLIALETALSAVALVDSPITVNTTTRNIFANGNAITLKQVGDPFGKYDDVRTNIYLDSNLNTAIELPGVDDGDTTDGYLLSSTNPSFYDWKVFGGADGVAYNGNTSVTMESGSVAVIFGGCYKGKLTGNSNLIVEGGAVKSLIGGGSDGSVDGTTSVTIGKDTTGLMSEIYGGGARDTERQTGKATVTLDGCTVNGAYFQAFHEPGARNIYSSVAPPPESEVILKGKARVKAGWDDSKKLQVYPSANYTGFKMITVDNSFEGADKSIELNIAVRDLPGPVAVGKYGVTIDAKHFNADAMTSRALVVEETDGISKLWWREPPANNITVDMTMRNSFTSTDTKVTAASGPDLKTVVKNNAASGNVIELTITEGKFTAEDWKSIGEIREVGWLETFIIKENVKVANMPAPSRAGSLFPDSIITVIVPQEITVSDYAFSLKTSLKTVEFDGATSIGGFAFDQCYKLETIKLSNVKTIGQYAFQGCGKLQEVDLPEAVTISNDAFRSCPVSKVTLPKAETIGDRALGTSKLTSIELPKAKTIGASAFGYVTTLVKADLPAAVTIGEKAFEGCSGLTDLRTPNVTSVGGKAFASCTSLEKAEFPLLKTVGESAFEGCEALKEVNIPQVETIEASAFNECIELTNVSFPMVQTIKEYAFRDCEKLKSASFPSVVDLDESIFSFCGLLDTLTLGAVPPPNVKSGFVTASGGTLTVPVSAVKTYDSVDKVNDGKWFGWTLVGGSDVPGAVTGVTLDKPTLSLAVGKSETLVATIAPATAPNKAVTWKTSNPAIATVDTNGVVTGVQVGTATITVTTTDGGKTATCAVTVTAAVSKPAPGGKLEAPLTQAKVDEVFGQDNATLDDTANPPKITVNGDIITEKPIEVVKSPLEIDLGGSIVTGKPGESPIVVGGGSKVTIDGSGTVSGGDNTSGGAGGNGITGGTGSDITIGGGVTVEGGGGTTGGGGIVSGGNVTVGGGTVTGGDGSSGNGGTGVDTSGGAGNIVINGGGSTSGGSSTGGSGSGGSGASSGSGSVNINGGNATGGKGSGTGSGGNGAGSSGGDIIVGGGGNATGGSGGETSGNGGGGAQAGGSGDVTINGGNATGGSGSGTGSGGNGAGSSGGDITVSGDGNATGGSGGETSGNGGGGAQAGGSGNVKIDGGKATGGNGSGTGSGGNGAGSADGDVTVSGGSATGGNGSGTGSGGNGAGSSSGDVTVSGGKATGGDGGSSGAGGNGGNGTNAGNGKIDISGGSANGGDGGGTSGGGGSGAGSSGGNITVSGGSANGGNGSGTGSGGNGAGSSSGDITVDDGGSATGGSGGDAPNGGGIGGNGTSSDGGSTTINGSATGGEGGSATVDGNGGSGGNGAADKPGDTVSGSGTVTGGDGGYGSGSGAGGKGGTGLSTGVNGGSLTVKNGKNGRTASVKVESDKAGTTVTVPNVKELVDASLTQLEKDDASITGVNVVLSIEKQQDPSDKELAESALPGSGADVIGAYFDIKLTKTVTRDDGRPVETSEVTDLSGNAEITITIPADMRGGSKYVVIHVHNGAGKPLETKPTGVNELTFKVTGFSTFAIAYTKAPPSPSSGGTSGGGGSSSNNDGYDFWTTVKSRIKSANDGDVIKVNARRYDKMPASVMSTLRKQDDVTLVISWSGGKTITIPSGEAKKPESTRVYYPLSLLAELYGDVTFVEQTDATQAEKQSDGQSIPGNKFNPETGGGYLEYADGRQVPVGGKTIAVDAPTTANTQGNGLLDASVDAPAVVTPPTAGFEPEAFAGTSDARAARGQGSVAAAAVAALLAALAGGGLWIWKRKQETL